ncbi:hypothetical protein [uncultured Rhodospira sp.]|uniref:hypothetical protein n=1 Tax=uncultured Rhodospira sp. TaxID=1936189 RepID=UPI002631AB1D|nr:hypothetical protein [uncultured Rhodospira sp.]
MVSVIAFCAVAGILHRNRNGKNDVLLHVSCFGFNHDQLVDMARMKLFETTVEFLHKVNGAECLRAEPSEFDPPLSPSNALERAEQLMTKFGLKGEHHRAFEHVQRVNILAPWEDDGAPLDTA